MKWATLHIRGIARCDPQPGAARSIWTGYARRIRPRAAPTWSQVQARPPAGLESARLSAK